MSRNMTIVLLVLLVCASLVHVNGQFYPAPYALLKGCPPGEVFKTCQSSTCGENDCSHFSLPGPLPCTADCVTGCFCKDHMYRNERGRCVHWLRCPTIRDHWSLKA
uniref:TIL domain containing protein n=1 Tax=Rhipicephalus zambeziensis TaxID=60191 RepID=A0A224YRK8_9ACAR